MTKDEFMRKMRDLIVEYEYSSENFVGVLLSVSDGDEEMIKYWNGSEWSQYNPNLWVSLDEE